MQYAILCYHDQEAIARWTKEEDDACMARLLDVQQGMKAKGKLGPVARLLPTTTAWSLRKSSGEPLVLDGPFAETKEQFLGFYVVDCKDMDEALDFARELAIANPGLGSYEIRPVDVFNPTDGASGK